MVFLQVTRWQGLVEKQFDSLRNFECFYYVTSSQKLQVKRNPYLSEGSSGMEWSETLMWWLSLMVDFGPVPLGRKRIKPWNDSINGTITWLLVKGMCFPGESPLNSAMPIRGLCDVPYTSCKKRKHGHNHTAIYQWSNFGLWDSLHHTSFTTKIDL